MIRQKVDVFSSLKFATTVDAIPYDQDSPPSGHPSDPAAAIPQTLIGRFGEFTFLGAGGMGSVYRAKDQNLGRDVAIKFLHQADPETNGMLLREARAQARLDHENACKVYEVGMDTERPYIVMQYIAGESLDRLIKGMTREEKVRTIQLVALALHEAHRLGIVHRDVKPSNIMIETGEDGASKPYIMDFGIAREMGSSTQTTSSFAGTPSYMAPEQAIGDVAALDRRTDVYALGATLYDLLAGRAPFEGSHAVAVLQKLLSEDAPPLRKSRPDVPVDLEAIVMKCLEKEPGRRYDSAKALADDLQRFLDGTSVIARRASLGYVIVKYVRRHKWPVAVVIALVAVVSAFGAVWVRERQAKAEQAEISRELGENVKEMELFLSRAYGLPLHDIERERRIVRDQLHEIEVRMVQLGSAGEGPGHYALGRGFLALHGYEEALSHLRRAAAAGYAPPELRYAMGLALVELHRKALDDAKRIQDEERKKARIAAIDAEFKQPALVHLRAALGPRLSSPAYVEGLIALHEGRNEIALNKAREAFKQSPWMYEAKKLEGDALFAEGKRFGRDAAFDFDKMMQSFEPAAAAFAEAATIARSDPTVHEAECELWTQVVIASDARPEHLRSSFDKATNACEKALVADPGSVSAHLTMAFVQNAFVWQAQNNPQMGDLEKLIQTAIERAENAGRVLPNDPMAHYLVGNAHRTALVHLMNRGLDARTDIDRAIEAHEQAIRLDPSFLWPYNEVCASYVERAAAEIWRGIDPAPSVAHAVERCDQAIALDPHFTLPGITKAYAHVQRAHYLVENGRSPEASVTSALAAAAAVAERNPLDAATISAWATLHQATFENATGRDPHDSLDRAETFLRAWDQAATSSNDEFRGLLWTIRTRDLLRRGKDPLSAIAEARAFFHKSIEATPGDVDYRVEAARVEILGLRWAIASKKGPKAAQFEQALKLLLPILEKERANPHVYQTHAELYELRAVWLLEQKKPATDDLTTGIFMADKALGINPHLATALASKGFLHLLQARVAADPEAKKLAASKAKIALEAAIRDNPLLARERNLALQEAAALLVSK